MRPFYLTSGGEGSPKIDPDAIVGTAIGIVGQRGTGKSSAAAVIVEEVVAKGGRCVVADPVGVWWGLAHAGDGPGLKKTIILGGEHANAPLEETGGKVAADLVLNGDYSVVILDMKLLRKAAQIRFMADFLEDLYHGNRESLLVVLDEAGRFAPQSVRQFDGGGPITRLLGAIEDGVKLGRSRGLGFILLEQRPAHVNKSVFEQVETLIAFRLMGPNDRKALSAWVEAQGDPAREKEAMDAIAKARTGEGLVWSPALLDFFGMVKFRLPHTFDSRRTPRPGERSRKPGERAPVDLDALTKKMADTIERAKENDPTALRAEVARLKRELEAARELLDIPKAEPKFVFREKEVERIEKAAQDLVVAAHDMKAAVGLAPDLGPREPILGTDGSTFRLKHITQIDRGQIQFKVPPPFVPIPTLREQRDRVTARVLGGGTKRIRDALYLHRGQLFRQALAVVSVMKASGGSFNTYLSRLKRAGHVEIGHDVVTLTDAGRKAAGIVVPFGPAEVASAWREKFGGGAVRIFDAMMNGREWTRGALAGEAGMEEKGGSFNTYISRLRAAGLVVDEDGGMLRINRLLLEWS